MARAKRFGSGERIPAKTVRDTSSATPTYSYDANGNRTNPGDTVGSDNQISTDGTWTYTYDKEGNVTQKTDAAGDKWQYTYDNANELVGATYTPTGTTVASTVCTYVYDVFGNKIEQEETVSGVTTITKFAYDGSTIWAAMSSSNALQTRYVYMDGSTTPVAQVSSSGTVNWYDTDYEGSVRVVTNNSTGAAVDTITYDAYGNMLSQSAPVSGQFVFYAGGVYDSALGFVLFVDHWYNPVTGSWMQQDELFPESGVNPYEYGGNDPSNEIDPTGLDDGPVPGEVIIYPGQTTVSPNGAGQGVPGEAIIGAGRNVVTVGPDAVVVSNMPQPPAPGFWESAVNRYWAGVKYDVASLASALERDWRNFKNDPGGYLLRSLNPLPLLEAVGRTVENGINNLYPSMVDLVEQLGENPGGVAGEFAWELHKAWAFWIFGEWAFGGEVPCPKQGAAVVEDGAAASVRGPKITASTWQEYEKGVRALHGDVPFSKRQYQVIVDGEIVNGIADNVAEIAGKRVAIDAKFVKGGDWANSIRNPASPIGGTDFAIKAQEEMLAQAKAYSAAFDEVIYYSNSPELIAHYTKVFQDAGIKNFRFVLTE